jgi:hypothetical protein
MEGGYVGGCMDSQSLDNVLALLRGMRADGGAKVVDIMRTWAADTDETGLLKVASSVQEQVRAARIVIENSRLSEEAREGVLQTLNGLQAAFSLRGIQGTPSSHIPNLASSISNFVILLDVLRPDGPPRPPEDAANLVKEIEDLLLSAQEDKELDPVVRDTVRRHLKILSTLLQHIPIFGLEPALATYFELMMKVRRAETGSTEQAKAKMEPIWKRMEKWGERLVALDKIWNAGARIIGNANKAQDLLTYIPDV